MFKNRFVYFVIALFQIIIGTFLFSKVANAAEPKFMITWKSSNYAPSWFDGKIFPINNSSITVSFEAISQNKEDFGKILDLKDKEVRWYINGDQVGSGYGKKLFSFKNGDFSGSDIDIRISLEYFDVELEKSYFVDKYFVIPIKSPEIIIENKSFSSQYPIGSKINLRAIPLFFNSLPELLNIQWNINNKIIENIFPNLLEAQINIESEIPGNRIRVNVFGNKLGSPSESGASTIFLNIIK